MAVLGYLHELRHKDVVCGSQRARTHEMNVAINFSLKNSIVRKETTKTDLILACWATWVGVLKRGPMSTSKPRSANPVAITCILVNALISSPPSPQLSYFLAPIMTVLTHFCNENARSSAVFLGKLVSPVDKMVVVGGGKDNRERTWR